MQIRLIAFMAIISASLFGVAHATDHYNYDPDTGFSVTYQVPQDFNTGNTSNLGVCSGEKVIIRVEAADNYDGKTPIYAPVPPGTPGTRQLIAGAGPYGITFSVAGDAEFDSAGSGLTTKTVGSLTSDNVYLFVKNTWGGGNITVTATIQDLSPAVVPPDTGTTKDADKTLTWTLTIRGGAAPTTLTTVAGANNVKVRDGSKWTYQGGNNPPPAYQNQTVLESFGLATDNGFFTMASLTDDWKKNHPTKNTPSLAAAAIFSSSDNGTFVLNANNQMTDGFTGFGDTSPFTTAALAAGIGYRQQQTYSCCGSQFPYTYDAFYQAGVTQFKKYGP